MLRPLKSRFRNWLLRWLGIEADITQVWDELRDLQDQIDERATSEDLTSLQGDLDDLSSRVDDIEAAEDVEEVPQPE